MVAGLGGLLLLGQALWELINRRGPLPDPGPLITSSSQDFIFPAPTTVRVTGRSRVFGRLFWCGTNAPNFSEGGTNPVTYTLANCTGVRIVGGEPRTVTMTCAMDNGAGVSFDTRVDFRNAQGQWTGEAILVAGYSGWGSGRYGTIEAFVDVEILVGPSQTPVLPPQPPRAPQLPQVMPLLPDVLPEADPGVTPVPAPNTPAPVRPAVPVPAPPFPLPVPISGGFPGRTPGRTPGQAPAPAQAPWPRPPVQSQAPPITASGVRPQLPPAPQPTNTGTTFLPGGRPLVPNGPPPTMQGITTELGKLEQKMEMMLNPDDTLSPLALLNRVIDQVENIKFLLELLFPPEPYTFPAGAYEIAPVCDRDSEGELVPPLQAPWDGGEGELLELRQKLDALALLIQHHKTLKQPTCAPRGNGNASNVTLHFASD